MQHALAFLPPVRATYFAARERYVVPIIRALAILILLVATFLAFRRAIGAMSALLPAWPLCATALVLLIWVLGTNLILRASTTDLPAPLRNVVIHSPLISLVLVAFACSYPGARVVDWLVWLPTFAAAWFGMQKLPIFLAAEPSPLRLHPDKGPAEEAADQILQQLTRFRTADGRDALSGTITAEFAPGQRSTSLYVGFCPPFTQLPQVEAQIADDGDAVVQLTQVLHQGAQLDVRLPRPAAAPVTATIELFATDGLPPV